MDGHTQTAGRDTITALSFDCGAPFDLCDLTAARIHLVEAHRPARDATEAYVLVGVLGGPHGHGRAAQRALAPIWPHRVARARAPAALGRSVAGDRLIPRHGHGQSHGGARDAPAGG
jgi:hypothetical protein